MSQCDSPSVVKGGTSVKEQSYLYRPLGHPRRISCPYKARKDSIFLVQLTLSRKIFQVTLLLLLTTAWFFTNHHFPIQKHLSLFHSFFFQKAITQIIFLFFNLILFSIFYNLTSELECFKNKTNISFCFNLKSKALKVDHSNLAE